MDRQATFGFILIFVVLLVWMWWNAPQQKPPTEKPAAAKVQDSVQAKTPAPQAAAPVEQKAPGFGKFFAVPTGKEQLITVETDEVRAVFTSRGGLIKSWEMKNYKTWAGYPVELVDAASGGDFSLLFTSSDGRVIDTKDLEFEATAPSAHAVLTNNFEFEIVFTLRASNGGRIEKVFRMQNGRFGVDVCVRMVNMESVLAGYEYQIVWEHGIRYAEHNSVDESSFAAAYAYAGGELTEIDATKNDQKEQKELSGTVDWVATRNKYFGVAMMPKGFTTDGAYLEGIRHPMPDNGERESYTVALKVPYKGGAVETDSLVLFIGPLQHGILKSYERGLERMMSLGWAWLIRPISEYVMLPLFSGIHYFVPNWGLVIIIFSIIIKLALHPLSKSQMESMKKMQKLQPLMTELREKYKDNPDQMNRATMNLYKEYGVNPAGGCLPLLLQMPIMYALYAVFRSAFELRQAGFVWWIKDLSIPDVAFTLPFRVPFFGFSDVSGIALIMGVTMFVQQKMTTAKAPTQQMPVWLMPVMLTLLFNGFPSGLNLYYAVFNILSIGQQFFINKKHDDEPLRKVEPKKKNRGGIFQLAKDMPRLKK